MKFGRERFLTLFHAITKTVIVQIRKETCEMENIVME